MTRKGSGRRVATRVAAALLLLAPSAAIAGPPYDTDDAEPTELHHWEIYAFGAGVQLLLPLWAQKDAGAWSVFGGGGYTINPGPGQRDFWQAGLAVTRSVSHRLSLGAEASRQGADSVGAGGTTRLGLGGIYSLGGPYSLLASAGPEFRDGRSAAGFHAYLALGVNF